MSDTQAPPILICPSCMAPGLAFDEEAKFECQYCGTVLLAERTTCPSCRAHYPMGVDVCVNCKEPLTVIASILDRQGLTGPPLWIRRLRWQVGPLKEQEERASALRFDALMEVDRRRLHAEAIAQRAKDSHIRLYGIVGLLLLALAVLMIVTVIGVD